MGRGEGPVQRRHRRQLCERVQYVRERVSGKESARTTRPGRAAAPGSPGQAVLRDCYNLDSQARFTANFEME